MYDNKWQLFKNQSEEVDIIDKWKNNSKRSLSRKPYTPEELEQVFAIPEINQRFSEDEVFVFAMKSIQHCQAILNSGYCNNKPELQEKVENCIKNLNIQRFYHPSGP
jgi:hypothetical protein